MTSPLYFAVFQMLAGVLDSIIHSGASVNLVRSYQSLKAVNVLGTQVHSVRHGGTYSHHLLSVVCNILI